MTNKIVEEQLKSEWNKTLLKPESFVSGMPSIQHQEKMWIWIKEQFDRVATAARKEEAQEIMARFDEMVTLTAKDFERSDIVNFRGWLRRRLQQLSKGK